MRQQAALAYQQAAKRTVSPRELEANILSKSAANLARIKDDWDNLRTELPDALLYNRKLWTVFLETVTREDNPLPKPIRENVANLGIFVLKHTIEIQVAPAAGKLDVLININRELAAGLRSVSSEAE
jgi:flagellar biosynthesis activator protein FlaF